MVQIGMHETNIHLDEGGDECYGQNARSIHGPLQEFGRDSQCWMKSMGAFRIQMNSVLCKEFKINC